MYKIVTNAIIIALLVVILVQLNRKAPAVSYYMEAAPLVTNSTGPSRPESIFAIQPSLECTPGPGEKSSYYSSGLTPGGLCGDGDYVRQELREYSIADGIGGSLLEK
jgi:hypothetical protein